MQAASAVYLLPRQEIHIGNNSRIDGLNLGSVLISVQLRKVSGGKETALRENHKMKVQVSFSLIIFHSLLSLSLPLWTVNDPMSGRSPGRYTVGWMGARGMLPAEGKFLLFVSDDSNNAIISKEDTVPFACPVCAE